jgi:hypothetical protein
VLSVREPSKGATKHVVNADKHVERFTHGTSDSSRAGPISERVVKPVALEKIKGEQGGLSKSKKLETGTRSPAQQTEENQPHLTQ